MECNFTLCRFNTEYEVNKKGVCKCKTPERFCKYLQLEKENAELEEYKNGNFVQTVNQIIEGKDKRLEQAKELLERLVTVCKIVPLGTNYDVVKKAEQFLKGENIILEDAQVGNSPFDADEVFNKEMKAYPEEK